MANNPTYFARIGNEDQRKIAEMLANGINNRHGDSEIIEFDGEGFVLVVGRPVSGAIEIAFPDFIRRFVPLSVIGSLAKCHGQIVVEKELFNRIVKAQ